MDGKPTGARLGKEGTLPWFLKLRNILCLHFRFYSHTIAFPVLNKCCWKKEEDDYHLERSTQQGKPLFETRCFHMGQFVQGGNFGCFMFFFSKVDPLCDQT